jgi:SlyX protein
VTEDRFIDIEIKLAHQEDLVESLNQMVYEQQKRMDKLEALCAALAQHIRDGATQGGPNAGNEKPPHY